MTGPERKKTVTIAEANHEVPPRDPRSRESSGVDPSPARTGTAADALLDDAAGRSKSETESALERAAGEDRSETD